MIEGVPHPSEAAPQTRRACGSASLVTVLALPRSGVPIARTVRDGVFFAGRAVLTGER